MNKFFLASASEASVELTSPYTGKVVKVHHKDSRAEKKRIEMR